jgi:predicted nucleic acid-binding protein
VILVDTSAWVEFDRATGSAVDLRLNDLLGSGADIAVTEPIVMEVLAGARDDRRWADLRALMLVPRLLTLDPVADFEGAALIYRRCRGRGVTPRGMVDCLIAAVAQRLGVALLAADADLVRAAAVVGIDLDRPT